MAFFTSGVLCFCACAPGESDSIFCLMYRPLEAAGAAVDMVATGGATDV